jgi:nucleotide-binding universal stress UspA family protein
MKPERILLPIDVTRCPVDVFDVVNGFAHRPEVTVILLHVVSLNIVSPESRVYEELSREALWSLDRLADNHLHPLASPITHVRSGKPAEQILNEAKAERVDLIILPTFGPSLWKRLSHFWNPPNSLVSPLAEKIIRDATCAVFVVLARKWLDCTRVGNTPRQKLNDLPDDIFPTRPDIFEPARCSRVRPISRLTARRL